MSFSLLPGRRSRRATLASLARIGILAGVALAGLQLSGCGGSNPVSLFYAPEQFANVGGRSVSLGRTFVKLDNSIPVEVGWEFPENMLADLPDSAFGDLAIYLLPMPAEAVNTPFKTVVFSDWAGGHPPVDVGAEPHIHPIFLMSDVQPPSENLKTEQIHIANPDEIPPGFEPGDVIASTGGASNAFAVAPGIGLGYEERDSVQLHPGWKATAQNWFVYNGHLNGIGMGQVYEFLAAKKSETLNIKQPKVYPKPGWYPTKQTTRWIESKKVYSITLTDFVQAKEWVH